MTQLDLFTLNHKIPNISGLEYIPNYISGTQENELIKIIDSKEWLSDLKRRVQHYGYKYYYTSRSISSDLYIGEVPDWLLVLSDMLPIKPDQVIINEYLPGQGISPHIDCIPCFTDIICSLSLLSPCVMEFTKKENKPSILLEPRSLLILSGPARFEWKHGIAARKQDVYSGKKMTRERRVSITFRKVKL